MRGRFVAYLDLMCCGFGGALLLFLIVSMAQPPRQPSRQIVVVRVRAAAETKSPLRGEIGVEYRRRGENVWQRGVARAGSPAAADKSRATSKPVFFTSQLAEQSGNEAVLIWQQPPSGEWEFQAYLAESSLLRETPPDNEAGVQVVMEVYSREGLVKSPTPDTLRWPGDTGRTLRVRFAER